MNADDRNAIIEECAEVAQLKKVGSTLGHDYQTIYNAACDDIAAAIRALKSDTGG